MGAAIAESTSPAGITSLAEGSLLAESSLLAEGSLLAESTSLAEVTPLPGLRRPDTRAGLAGLLAEGTVRPAERIGADAGVLSGAGFLPVLPALRDLLPDGGLARGSVLSAGTWSLLCLALAAGPAAAGAWCAAVGIPELGVAAAAGAGLDPARLLLIGDPGAAWQQVVASLLDGCELVMLRPPVRPPAQVRRKLEAAVRRHGAVLLVADEWDGAQVRLRIAAQEWAGVGTGHGRLRGRLAQVVADGRGGWSRPKARWLWLPGPDGAITSADPAAVASTVTGSAVAGSAMGRTAASGTGAAG